MDNEGVLHIASHMYFVGAYPAGLQPRCGQTGLHRWGGTTFRACRWQAGSFLKEISVIVRATCRNLPLPIPAARQFQRGPGRGRGPRAEATLLRSQRLGLGRGGTKWQSWGRDCSSDDYHVTTLVRLCRSFSFLNLWAPGWAGRVSLGAATLHVVLPPKPDCWVSVLLAFWHLP